MTDQTDASPAAPPRKPWTKPEATPLPVEETAHNASTGNDGNGPTSHS